MPVGSVMKEDTARSQPGPHNEEHGSSGSLPGGNEESPVGSRFALRRVRRCPAAVMEAPVPSVRTLAVPKPLHRRRGPVVSMTQIVSARSLALLGGGAAVALFGGLLALGPIGLLAR